MKRFLACLLAFSVLMICTACFEGGVDTPVQATQDNHEPSVPTQSTTTPTQPSTKPAEPEKITLQETVIYDDQGIKITVKELLAGWSGPELKVLVENNTTHNIVFSGSEFIVNGVTISGHAYIDVAAGKKTNDTITIYDDDLEVAGIQSLATIQGMDFRVYDSDSYVDLFDVAFTLTTSIAGTHAQNIDDSGDVLFEKSEVTVIAKKLHEDWLGYTVVLFVRNDTGKEIIVNADDISVNGFTITGWLYDHVYANSVRFCEITISSSSLAENDIEKIETVTFTIDIIDADTYNRIATSEEIGITVG